MLCNSSLSAHGFPTFGIYQHPLCRETSWTCPCSLWRCASCLRLGEFHLRSQVTLEFTLWKLMLWGWEAAAHISRFSRCGSKEGDTHLRLYLHVFACVYVCYDSRADAAFQVLVSSPQSCLWLERKHISNTHLLSSLSSNIFLKYIWHFSSLEEFSFIILQSCYSEADFHCGFSHEFLQGI